MSAIEDQARSIFLAAVERGPDEWPAFLDVACGSDADLRARVDQLLHAHQTMGSVHLGGVVDPVAAGALPRGESTGTLIGPYKLLQQIGEGGMGTVYMAEQAHPVQRKVALKLIKVGMDSRQVLARFEAERQALALMDHPNIAKVLDAGTSENGRPYFVMELVKGVPITGYCDEHHLTPRERLELFVPICQAVQHAHQKGIIHRDMKPSNVMVCIYDGRPVPKVIDFGVAKATGPKLTERTLYTEFGAIVGTFEYMSPEQSVLDQLDVDTRSDIYSLGVLLYELLTGTTPLERKRMKQVAILELLRLIREEEAPRPSARLRTTKELLSIAANRATEPKRLSGLLRGELDWIVMKALDKDRARRYETASAFAADVERYLKDEAVAACPPSFWYRLRKFARRNRGAVLAATAVLVTLVAGMVGTGWGLVQAWRQTAAADKSRDEEAAQRKHAQEQRNRAAAEAATARAVSDFLQTDLLGTDSVGNRPLVGQGAQRDPNITVVKLLDRAAKAIDGKFAGQPLTEAAIRLTMGDTYRALGRYAEAQPHLERSVQLRTVHLGTDHPDTLLCKNALAGLYGDLEKLDRAEPLLKEIIAGSTARLGPDHISTLTYKDNLATFYLGKGRFDRAEPLFKEVLAAEVIQLGPQHGGTLITKSNLADLYQQQGKYELAEPIVKAVLEIRSAQLGADHLDTLNSKNNLASLYWVQKKYDEAEPLYLEVVAGFIAQLGADHPDTLQAKNNLATVYRGQRKNDLAEPLLREVLEVRLIKLGADHRETLSSKLNLAMLYQSQGKYGPAEALDKEALVGYTALFGPEHPQTLTSKHNLAFLYEVQHKYDQAEPLFREAIAGLRKKLGIAHPNTQTSIRHLIVCLEQMDQPAQAESLLRELADFWRENAGASSPLYAERLLALGSNLVLQEKGTAAEAVLRPSLAISQQKQADAWTTFYAQSLLGGALLLEKKHAEAEPLLLVGYQGMKLREAKIPVLNKIRLVEALERLAQLYEATGQKDKAKEWQKKLADANAPAQPAAKR
jgi:eukaryotic-like serine/threonine-protein kinase